MRVGEIVSTETWQAVGVADHELPHIRHVPDGSYHAYSGDESDGVIAVAVRAYGRGDEPHRTIIEVYATSRERAEHVWYYLRDVVAPTVWCDAPTPNVLDAPEVTP